MTGRATRTFLDALDAARDPGEVATIERRLGPGDATRGIRMRDLFAAARASSRMPLTEVEMLLSSPLYEVRMGALCILDLRARSKRSTDSERRDCCTIYLDHHDRVTTWDMVDRAAPGVVGGWLRGRDTAVLHELARDPRPLHRRTAITAPLWFVRYGERPDLAVVLTVAAALADDPRPVVSNAVGIALKHLGGRDPDAVVAFMETHGRALPRPAQRAAMSKVPGTR